MEMDAQPRPFLIGPLAVFLALAVLSPRASVSDDQTRVDASAGKTPGETIVLQKLVDIISFRGNLRKLQAASADFKRIAGSDDIEAGWVFEALSDLDDIDFLTPDSPANFRYDLLLTTPAIELTELMSLPIARDKLRNVFDEDDFGQDADGTLTLDGMPMLVTDDHCGILFLEDTPVQADVTAMLDRAVKETRNARLPAMFAASSQPRAIGRSALKPHIAVVRAGMAAEAQRRDDEPDIDFFWRSLYHRSVLRSMDLLFSDIERIEYSMDWSEADELLTLQLRIDAAEKSSLDQYIQRVRSRSNRALSWLHPDHENFCTASLPVPDVIGEQLPDLGRVTAGFLGPQMHLSDTTSDQIQKFFVQCGRQGAVEVLIQTIPVSDGSLAIAGVVPFENSAALSPAVVELVSATGAFEADSPITDVAGWPLHRLDGFDQFDTAGAPGGSDLYFVTTDHSVEWIIGTEAAIPLLETIVLREYPASELGSPFRRTAFALKCSAESLAKFGGIFPGLEAALPKRDAAEIRRDDIEVVLDTDPHSLLLTARLQRDVALTGSRAVDTVTELIAGLLDL